MVSWLWRRSGIAIEAQSSTQAMSSIPFSPPAIRPMSSPALLPGHSPAQPQTPFATGSPNLNLLQLQQHQYHQQQPGTPSALFLGGGAVQPASNPLLRLGGAGAGPSPSIAGSAISNSTTTADAPHEARRVIRQLLDEQGQGRLSLLRIQREIQNIMQTMCVAVPSQVKGGIATPVAFCQLTRDIAETILSRRRTMTRHPAYSICWLHWMRCRLK